MRWKVGHHDLKSNGIRVYYFYDSGGTTHICGVGFRVGAAYDPMNAGGIAHLAEHLTSRESLTFDGDEVYRIMWRYLGGPVNLKIETDHTSTYYGGPSLYYRKYMHAVMPMFVSLVRDRLITAAGMGTEKGAVNNEISLTEGDVPLEKLNLAFYQAMYETNPIRHSILGTVPALEQITADRVRRFIKKFYVAQNMFAIVFGPTKNDSIKFAEKYLSDWPYSGSAAVLDTNDFDKIPNISSPKIVEVPTPGIGSFYVELGFPTEGYNTDDDAVLDVISEIMWLRGLNILREENRDPKKGIYRSPGFAARTFIHGVVGSSFSTIDKDFALYGRERMLKEFLKLKEDLVPGSLVDTMVGGLREEFLINFRNSPEEVVDLVIEATSNGDPDLVRLHFYPDRLSKVTPKKIRNVANKYFNNNGYACAMLTPA